MKKILIALAAAVLLFVAMSIASSYTATWGSLLAEEYGRTGREATLFEMTAIRVGNFWSRYAVFLGLALVATFACWGAVASKRAAAERLQRGA